MGKSTAPDIPVPPAPQPPTDFTACPYWGQGGRYLVGEDGRRIRIDADGQPIPETPMEGQ